MQELRDLAAWDLRSFVQIHCLEHSSDEAGSHQIAIARRSGSYGNELTRSSNQQLRVSCDDEKQILCASVKLTVLMLK